MAKAFNLFQNCKALVLRRAEARVELIVAGKWARHVVGAGFNTEAARHAGKAERSSQSKLRGSGWPLGVASGHASG